MQFMDTIRRSDSAKLEKIRWKLIQTFKVDKFVAVHSHILLCFC